MRILDRFDRWLSSGPFTYADLGCYRLIYALFVLLVLPSAVWVSDYPSWMYEPPAGPFTLLSQFPPRGALVALQAIVALAAAFLLLGLWTVPVSWVLAIALIATWGFSSSLGKIDHTILVAVAPIFLSLAGWGRSLSIDRLLRPEDRGGPAQAPMRLFAVAIGVAFATAAAPKALSGWLDIGTQATQGHLYRQVMVHGRDDLLAQLAIHFDAPIVWELIDWFTVLLEVLLVFAFLSWRLLRGALALAAIFHLGVLLIMNIAFSWNLIAYGAFVSWGAAATSRRADVWLLRVATSARISRGWALLGSVIAAIVIATLAWGLSQLAGLEVAGVISWAAVILGAAAGLTYLIRTAVIALTAPGRRSSRQGDDSG